MTHATDDVLVPNRPALEGLRFRRFRGGDWSAIADLVRAAHLADGVDWLPTEASLRITHEQNPWVDMRDDILVAEMGDRIIAEADAETSIRDGRPAHRVSGVVHPDWRRRGIGRAMLRWNEARARERARTRPVFGGPSAELASWTDDGDIGAGLLYRSEGYTASRHGFDMRRSTLEGVKPIAMPRGLEIRPVTDAQFRAILDADEEAFRDHPGHRELTEADYGARLDEPALDTSLWRVAWAGTEVAGSVQAYIWREENAELGVRRGWLERISVRRPWRGRRLARALIASALIGLREAGMDEAMLDVVADNPSGAVKLYGSMGFTVTSRATGYRKPLAAAATSGE